MATVIAPISRYFGHHVRIHVAIFREVDCRRLNMECGLRAWPGIEWHRESKTLIISGVELKDADRNATDFYEFLKLRGYSKICGRIKHRMGRNGHGWPIDHVQAEAAKNAARIANDIILRFCD